MTSQITTLTAALKEQEVETAGLKAELAAQTRDYESLKQERQAAEEEAEEERTQRVAVDGMQVDEDAVTATPLSSSARAGAAAAAGGQATKPLHSDDERLPPMVVADDDDDAAAEHEVRLPQHNAAQGSAAQVVCGERRWGRRWAPGLTATHLCCRSCPCARVCLSLCVSVFVASPRGGGGGRGHTARP